MKRLSESAQLCLPTNALQALDALLTGGPHCSESLTPALRKYSDRHGLEGWLRVHSTSTVITPLKDDLSFTYI